MGEVEQSSGLEVAEKLREGDFGSLGDECDPAGPGAAFLGSRRHASRVDDPAARVPEFAACVLNSVVFDMGVADEDRVAIMDCVHVALFGQGLQALMLGRKAARSVGPEAERLLAGSLDVCREAMLVRRIGARGHARSSPSRDRA